MCVMFSYIHLEKKKTMLFNFDSNIEIWIFLNIQINIQILIHILNMKILPIKTQLFAPRAAYL